MLYCACFILSGAWYFLSHSQGCTELHHHIYQLIFRLFKRKHVKLEVCLGLMWESRRLSHALCPSPISDAFILSLSKNCGDKSTCIDFWIDCLKDSKARLIGFQQNFHDLQNDFLRSSKKDKGPFHSDITIDDITDAASDLISNVRHLTYLQSFSHQILFMVILDFANECHFRPHFLVNHLSQLHIFIMISLKGSYRLASFLRWIC